MAENSNINNKVTFWNNEAIEPSQFTFDSGNTNTYIITKTGLDKNGIYFNSASSYPHIIYNNKVFTAGSRINKVTKKDITTQYIPNDEYSETVNVITDIVTDPISRTIDYTYSSINIGYIYSEISRLWVEVNRESKNDELTISQPTLSNCLIGDTNNNVTWGTTTGKKPILVSKTSNITNCTVNDNGTLSITFASELSSKDVHTSEEKIVLKSQQGQTDGINYISQSKTISATLKKHEYAASLSGVPSSIAFNGQSTVEGSFNIYLTSCDPDGEITVSSSDTSRLMVSMFENYSSNPIAIGDKKSFKIYYKAIKICSTPITVTVTPSNTKKYYVTTDLQNKLTSTISLSEGTISVSSITLNKNSAELTGKGASATLTATVKPDNATNKTVNWSTSNSGIVAIDKGKITAISPGNATITARSTDGTNISATCGVTVNQGNFSSDVSLSADKTRFSSNGGPVKLTATVQHNLFGNITYTWYKDNEFIRTTTNTNNISLTVPVNESETENKTIKYKVVVASATHTTISKESEITVTVDTKPVETKYYWYVGQENPASMTSISPIVDDNTSPGWRLIGDKIPTYSSSNKLWIGTNVIKTGSSLQKQYVIIPANSSAAPRDGAGNDASTVAMYNKLDNIVINNVTYKVYESSGKGFKFNLDIF